MEPPEMKDAYRQPLKLQPGCEHFQGKCKCDVPYHLRESTPVELQREALRNAKFLLEPK